MNEKILVRKSFKTLNEFLRNLGFLNEHPRQNEWVITRYNDAVVFKRKITVRGALTVYMVKEGKVSVGHTEMEERDIYSGL